jgi:hypothetical protein
MQTNGVTATGLTELTEVKLQRETILLSPVFSAIIHHVAPDGHDLKTGYVRLSAFSQVGMPTYQDRPTGLSINNVECRKVFKSLFFYLQPCVHSLIPLGQT